MTAFRDANRVIYENGGEELRRQLDAGRRPYVVSTPSIADTSHPSAGVADKEVDRDTSWERSDLPCSCKRAHKAC
jgi:hypothetical protein